MALTIDQARAISQGDQLIARFNIFCFEQTVFIVDHLKRGGSAIVDFSAIVDADQARRSLDFVAGACYGLHDPGKNIIYVADCLDESVFTFGNPKDIQQFLIEESRSTIVKSLFRRAMVVVPDWSWQDESNS